MVAEIDKRVRTNFNKKDKVVDNRVSVCTECKKGVFKQQDYKWTNEGYKHTGCIERQDEIKES